MDGASARKYHVAHQGRKFGPLSLVELSSRRLSSDMLVWCEGMPEWIPVGDIPELRPYVHHATASHTVAPPTATTAMPMTTASSSVRGYATSAASPGIPVPFAPSQPPMPQAGGGGRIKFLGISMIVLGTLGLLCCPVSAVGTFFQTQPVEMVDVIDMPTFAVGRAVVFSVMTAISIVMIAGGVGLLYRRRWAATTCLLSSIACLLTYLLTAALECSAYYLPLIGFARQAGAEPETVGFAVGFIASAAAAWVFGLICHSVMVFLLNSKAVRQNLR
jgi:hypothetical protein